MKLLLGSNLSQREKKREIKLVGENIYSFKAVPFITYNLLRIEGEVPISTAEYSIISFTPQLLSHECAAHSVMSSAELLVEHTCSSL